LKEEDPNELKLLVLGVGDCGKAALFEQLNSLFGDRKLWIKVIRNSVVQSMETLLIQSEKSVDSTSVSPIDTKLKGTFLRLAKDESFPPELAQVIKDLWKHERIQKTYEQRSNFKLSESAGYFLEKAEVVFGENYEPTQEDIEKCDAPASREYINETKIQISRTKFKLLDIGAQRNERKKWMSAVGETTAVLFLASLSEYDQVLPEDNTANKLAESIQIFHEIAAMESLKSNTIILLMTNPDLFNQKIKTTPLTALFPEFTEGDSSEEAMEFVKGKFLSEVSDQSRMLCFHFLNVQNSESVLQVFQSIKDLLTKSTLPLGTLL
jgi:GTPase SAR1 family protein